MTIQKWYWWLLGVWCFTGLPIYLLSQGMAGAPAYDVIGFLRQIGTLPLDNWDAFITRAVPTVLVLAQLLLPFALRRRDGDHQEAARGAERSK